MKIIFACVLLFVNYFIVYAGHNAKTNNLINKANTDLDHEAEEYKKTQKKIVDEDKKWKAQWESKIEEQENVAKQALKEIQELMGSNTILLAQYDPVAISEEAEAMEEHERNMTKDAENILASTTELRKNAEMGVENANNAVIEATRAVEEAMRALEEAKSILERAEVGASNAQEMVERRTNEMLRLKAKELRESEELQRQRATEEKAVQRLPELRKQFSVIEHARDMQAQYRLSIEAQEGRWEALNVHVTAADKQNEQLAKAKAKQVLLQQIQLLNKSYELISKWTTVDAGSLAPVVNNRHEILHLATKYLAVTPEQVESAVNKCKEPGDSHKNRNKFVGFFTRGGTIDTNEELISLIGYAICLYDELKGRIPPEKQHKLNTTQEDIAKAGENADEKVEEQVEAERKLLGIELFDKKNLKVTPRKGKEKIGEEEQQQEGQNEAEYASNNNIEATSDGNDSKRHNSQTLGSMVEKDRQSDQQQTRKPSPRGSRRFGI